MELTSLVSILLCPLSRCRTGPAPLVYCLALLLVVAAAAPGSAQAPDPSSIYRSAAPSVALIEVTRGDGTRLRGTGFLIGKGLLATNLHLLREMTTGSARFIASLAPVPIGKVVAADPVLDVALAEVAAPGLRPLALGDSTAVDVGDAAYVLGNPRGLTGTFANGNVSAVRERPGGTVLFQLSVPLNPGSSGSPVLDRTGRVIGMVRSTVKDAPSMGFAIPSAYLAELLRTVRAAARPVAPVPRRRATPIPSFVAPVISIGVPRWASAEATAYILEALIEERTAAQVVLRRGTTPVILSQMARGRGRFDVLPELWLPNQRPLFQKYVIQDRRVAVNKTPYAAFQGLCVPRYVKDRYGIETVADLKKPEIARLFDGDGDGYGEYWWGAEGWNSVNIYRVKQRDYGLSKYYEGFSLDEKIFMKILSYQYARKEPVLFYCYSPFWTMRRFDLSIVKEPPYRPDCYFVADPKTDPGWYANSRASCDGPTPKVYVAFASRLFTQAPKVARILRNFHPTAAIVEEWVHEIEFKGRPPAKYSREWIFDNEALVLSTPR